MSTPVLRTAKRREAALDTLDTKGRLYVESRMAGNPPLVSARMAGYSNPNSVAPDMERDLRVRQAIEESIKLETYQFNLDRDTVLAGFMDAVHMAQTATELVAAWREIAKVIGAYEPQKVDLTVNNTRQLQEMDDEQLAKLAAIDGEYEVIDFDSSDDEGDDAQ